MNLNSASKKDNKTYASEGSVMKTPETKTRQSEERKKRKGEKKMMRSTTTKAARLFSDAKIKIMAKR